MVHFEKNVLGFVEERSMLGHLVGLIVELVWLVMMITRHVLIIGKT